MFCKSNIKLRDQWYLFFYRAQVIYHIVPLQCPFAKGKGKKPIIPFLTHLCKLK